VAEAFGEAAELEAKGKKYVGPWEEKRLKDLPFGDLVRLWAICKCRESLPSNSDIIDWKVKWVKKWTDLVGIDVTSKKEIFKKAKDIGKTHVERIG
jgi:hypothetical protein